MLRIRVAEPESFPRLIIPAAPRGTKESCQTPGMAGRDCLSGKTPIGLGCNGASQFLWRMRRTAQDIYTLERVSISPESSASCVSQAN